MKTYGFNAVNAYGFGANQGFGFAPSQYLINYLSSGGTFTFSVDASSKMELTNLGSGDAGLSYAGAGLELGATQSVPLHVNYTLGSDVNTGYRSSSASITRTAITDGDNYVAVTTTSNDYIRYNISTYSAGKFLMTFDATVNSGTPAFIGYNDNLATQIDFDTPVDIVNGSNTIEIELRELTPDCLIRFEENSAFDFDMINIDIQQITTTGYLTYATDTEIVQIANDSDSVNSSKELYTDVAGGSMTLTSLGDGDYNATDTGVINKSFAPELPAVNRPGQYYILEFNATINSGSMIIGRYWDGTGAAALPNGNHSVSNGVNQILVPSRDTSNTDFLTVFNDTSAETYNIDFRDISIKEVLPDSTTYTLPASDTYRWAYVNENAFSTADLAALEANHNKIVEYALDNANSSLTATQGTDDKFFGFRENEGAYVVDALAGYGSENITNGTFDTDTGWFKDAEVTIADGVAKFRYVADTVIILRQGSGTFNVDTVYKIDFTISNYTAGNLDIRINAGVIAENISGNGTYSYIGKSGSTNAASEWELQLRATDSANFDIDNVSVKEATVAEISNYA